MIFSELVANNCAQAPLAGYTDVGMRYLCAKYGCGLVVTEMVSAMSLKQKNKTALDLLALEKPKGSKSLFAVQLFGHDPAVFAEVVRYDALAPFDVIDINMGCPVPKVTRNGEGSALMRDLSLASKIIASAAANTQKPVTVKFRKGFCQNDCNAVEFAKMCEDSGAKAVTVHGRTREQMYGGIADMCVVRQVAKAVNIPVYANGDIKSADDFSRAVAFTEAFGAAIGRAAVGRPWIYCDITGSTPPQDVFEDVALHYELVMKHLPPKAAAGEMKKHAAAYLKGRRGAKKTLAEIFSSSSAQEQLALLSGFFKKNKTDDSEP